MSEVTQILNQIQHGDPLAAGEFSAIKLRFFAGLSLEDAARAMGISRATAQRKWAYARAWLYGQLHD